MIYQLMIMKSNEAKIIKYPVYLRIAVKLFIELDRITVILFHRLRPNSMNFSERDLFFCVTATQLVTFQ